MALGLSWQNQGRRWLLGAVALLCMGGCAHQHRDIPPYSNDQEVSTLSSSVTASLHTKEAGFSGNGLLLYRKPEDLRLVLLTPFGTAALDFYLTGSRVTVIVPSRKTAYIGTLDDIPSRTGADSWRLIRWALSDGPSRIPRGPSCITGHAEALGTTSACYDADGLLSEKVTEAGDSIRYEEYAFADGVPFPLKMIIHDSRGGEAVINFDEPELNHPLGNDAFEPPLANLTILPLSSFNNQ